MKIGVITVQDSANFGSYLQAFALKKVLESMGHEVNFIKVRSEKDVRKVFFGTIKHPKYFFKNYLFNSKKYKLFLEDRKEFKEIPIEIIKNENFDIAIIGSDELWNVRTSVFTKECFYGVGIPIKRKVAFAISMGKAEESDYKDYPNLVEAIKQLDDIYVRDKRTKQNIKKMIGKECEMVCDPTFLIDVKEFKKEYDIPVKQKYLLVYSYEFTKKQQENIKRFAKEQNLIVVSACFNHKFCDICINCSPLQFGKLIQNSEYVITTTFHGTIFSILNQKQFISIPASQKVCDVLEKLKMQNNQFMEDTEDYDDFKKKLLEPIDFSISNKELLEWRKKSIETLKNILDR